MFLKACALSLLILLASFTSAEHYHADASVELDCVICLHSGTTAAVANAADYQLAVLLPQSSLQTYRSYLQPAQRSADAIRAPPHAC